MSKNNDVSNAFKKAYFLGWNEVVEIGVINLSSDDAFEIIQRAIDNDEVCKVFPYVYGQVSTSDTKFKEIVNTAVEKGLVHVIDELHTSAKLTNHSTLVYSNIIERTLENATQEAQDHHKMYQALYDLKELSCQRSSYFINMWLDTHGDALKVALDQGYVGIQDELDGNLYNAMMEDISRHGASEHCFGEDANIGKIAGILLKAGASAANDDYSNLKVVIMGKQFRYEAFKKISKNLKHDNNPEKITALNVILQELHDDGWPQEYIDVVVKAGASLDTVVESSIVAGNEPLNSDSFDGERGYTLA